MSRLSEHLHLDEELVGAAKAGLLDLVNLYVAEGADVHCANNESIKRAAQNGHIDVVQYLIDNGADLHANDEQALLLATMNGQIEAAKLLLSNGADPSVDHSKVLRWCVEYSSADIIKLLVVAGASLTDVKDEGGCALIKAFQLGNIPVMKYISSLPCINPADRDYLLSILPELNDDSADVFLTLGCDPEDIEPYRTMIKRVNWG